MSTHHEVTNESPPPSSRAPHGATPATTTGVVRRNDLSRISQPAPWDHVEAYVRTGEHQQWIEAYAAAVPEFAEALAKRLGSERPPWELVERHLHASDPHPWVEWYARATPPFAALIEARQSGEQPPWELVDEYLRTREYREWIEDHARRSRSFAEVLASMTSLADDEPEDESIVDGVPPSWGRVIPFRPRPRTPGTRGAS